MSLTELSLNIPTDHVANVFGQFDAYIKKIERTLNVTVVLRGESMKLLGEEHNLKKAEQVFLQLIELSKEAISLLSRMSIMHWHFRNAERIRSRGDRRGLYLPYDQRQADQAKDTRTKVLCRCDTPEDDRVWGRSGRYR